MRKIALLLSICLFIFYSCSDDGHKSPKDQPVDDLIGTWYMTNSKVVINTNNEEVKRKIEDTNTVIADEENTVKLVFNTDLSVEYTRNNIWRNRRQ